MQPIRVLLVEDHELVRAGVRSLLEKATGIQVVAEAGEAREGFRAIEAHQPDVVLLDVGLPGVGGLEMLPWVVKQFPNVRVIMLSMHSNEEYVWRSLRHGAMGYVLKNASPAELELAIRYAKLGKVYLTPSLSKTVIEDYTGRVGVRSNSMDGLTPRQRQILRLITEGRNTKEIADSLKISIKTVATHRAQLMERLNIHDIASLVRYAIRIGISATED